MRIVLKENGYTPQQLIEYLDMCVSNNGIDVWEIWDELKLPINAGVYTYARAKTGQYVLIGTNVTYGTQVLYVDELGLTHIYSNDEGIIQKASASDSDAILIAFGIGVSVGARNGDNY